MAEQVYALWKNVFKVDVFPDSVYMFVLIWMCNCAGWGFEDSLAVQEIFRGREEFECWKQRWYTDTSISSDSCLVVCSTQITFVLCPFFLFIMC
jgi:hypothetical protein